MTSTYPPQQTALLLIDPYNDFLSEGGKLADRAMAVATAKGTVFTNTDLDVQLKQRGIERLIVIELLANTCVETTAKYGAELGYHVTLVKDATAAFSTLAMQAAHELNGPTYAHAILGTRELLPLLNPASQAA